jgi:ubiquinone/menaquinone biosynthesis C-methylase UbiE
MAMFVIRLRPQLATGGSLGTHDEEVARLGLQHRIWRPIATDCWRRAGITSGSRVIDIGAGPGYATVDLAEIVGPGGEVLAVERSERFLDVARQACTKRGLTNVCFQQLDLMEQSLGALDFDFAWCRWVASFVVSPEKLIQNIAGALRQGGGPPRIPGSRSRSDEFADHAAFSRNRRPMRLERRP